VRVIKATFERTSEVAVERLFGAIGVYVLWTTRAKVRPTYIGEGYLLHRLSEHARYLSDRLDGTLAILGYGDTPLVKGDAQIVEHLLLAVAAQVDRAPTANMSGGSQGGVSEVFRSHGVLRINICGVDPLRDPLGPNTRLQVPKRIVLRASGDEPPTIEHGWNVRAITSVPPWRRVFR
jgi:hypothetical protein